MNTLTAFVKKLRLGQILTVLMAGLLLFTSTACNAGDVRGARPENPPVQMGGMNNPHKAGGDGYTNYQMSTDPTVNQSPAKVAKDRADLSVTDDRLLASTAESNASKLLYPGSAPMETDKFDPELGGDKALLNAPDGKPAQRQPVFDRSDPDANILERVGAAVKDASAFLKDSTEDAKESAVTDLNPLQK